MNSLAIRDSSRNLKVRTIASHGTSGANTTHQVKVTADAMILEDFRGTPLRAFRIDATVDIENSGINGLDTGTKSPATWYHIWVISNGRDGAQGLFSRSDSTPAMPPRFSFMAYVGAIYNTTDNRLISYIQNGQLAWAEKTYPLIDVIPPAAPVRVNLSASVPSTAASVILETSGATTIGGHFISNYSLGPTQNGPWFNSWMMVAGTPVGAGSVDHLQSIRQCEVILDSAQQIYASVNTADDRLEVHVLGWRY